MLKTLQRTRLGSTQGIEAGLQTHAPNPFNLTIKQNINYQVQIHMNDMLSIYPRKNLKVRNKVFFLIYHIKKMHQNCPLPISQNCMTMISLSKKCYNKNIENAK